MTSLLCLLLFCQINTGFGTSTNRHLSDGPSDHQIVTMGHRAWIERTLKQAEHSLDHLEEAERRFAWAQTVANEKAIMGRSNSKDLEDLQILIANITKSSFVIGDYMMLDKPYDHLYIAKSASLAAISLRNVLTDAPSSTKITEADVTKLLFETRKVHLNQPQLVEAFRARKGGFTPQQLISEFDRMSSMIKQTCKTKALHSDRQKKHILHLCCGLIRLTLGKDPLPY